MQKSPLLTEKIKRKLKRLSPKEIRKELMLFG
jgi:hypothetical protein